jgi:Putative threonine/serine exporter
LAPPLALFLPGVAITLAVIELTTSEVVSGSAPLLSGFVRLARLAFGILIATQVVRLSASELCSRPIWDSSSPTSYSEGMQADSVAPSP